MSLTEIHLEVVVVQLLLQVLVYAQQLSEQKQLEVLLYLQLVQVLLVLNQLLV
jgi:hypothetical protein